MELLALPLLGKGIQKAVDFIRNLFDEENEAPKWLWNLVPFGLGIAASFGLQVDLDQVSSLFQDASDAALRVVAGVVAGGLASGWHELDDYLASRAKAAKFGKG